MRALILVTYALTIGSLAVRVGGAIIYAFARDSLVTPMLELLMTETGRRGAGVSSRVSWVDGESSVSSSEYVDRETAETSSASKYLECVDETVGGWR